MNHHVANDVCALGEQLRMCVTPLRRVRIIAVDRSAGVLDLTPESDVRCTIDKARAFACKREQHVLLQTQRLVGFTAEK